MAAACARPAAGGAGRGARSRRRVGAALLLAACCAGGAHAAAPVFDVHVHLHDGERSIAQYAAQLREAGLDDVAYGAILMARRGEPETTRRNNDALIALSKRHPGLVPIASVHPMDGADAIAELDRLAALGVRAIKLHPHTQAFDVTDAQVVALCRHTGTRDIAILLDNANIVPGDSENLFNLAIACPRTRLVFAHMGGLNFRFWNILPLARTAEGLLGDNIHFDISAVVTLMAGSPLEEEFVWTLRNVGIDKVLLGSDFPQFTLRRNLEALDRLPLTDEEKRMIRHDNARRALFPATPAP